MEAPDKIFINEDVIALHILQTKYDGDIEYIRKDALLKWAEEEMTKAAKQSDSYGRRNAFMDVIDKLNSM